MATRLTVQAFERAFARLCELGRGVPHDTPAAGLLAAAARQIDAARIALVYTARPEEQVRARLAAAGTLLDDVARLSRIAPIDGGDWLTVVVDDLRVTLDGPPDATQGGRSSHE